MKILAEIKKQCPSTVANTKSCNCSYSGCEKHGLCCQCLSYHRSRRELPACYFPDEVEKTYDRSIRKFIEIMS
ncbi:MAG: cytosolic protein [Deltaproteobacteria bacterium]|nr:cytosolic protein [Deltaproteobacteria bacterium]